MYHVLQRRSKSERGEGGRAGKLSMLQKRLNKKTPLVDGGGVEYHPQAEGVWGRLSTVLLVDGPLIEH